MYIERKVSTWEDWGEETCKTARRLLHPEVSQGPFVEISGAPAPAPAPGLPTYYWGLCMLSSLNDDGICDDGDFGWVDMLEIKRSIGHLDELKVIHVHFATRYVRKALYSFVYSIQRPLPTSVITIHFLLNMYNIDSSYTGRWLCGHSKETLFLCLI